MRIIVLANSYEKASQYLREHFPYIPLHEFDVVADDRDIDMLQSCSRSTPYIILGGSLKLRDFCRARCMTEIQVIRHEV